jgi:hypothetical protein
VLVRTTAGPGGANSFIALGIKGGRVIDGELGGFSHSLMLFFLMSCHDVALASLISNLHEVIHILIMLSNL